jgi:hypothetical protein
LAVANEKLDITHLKLMREVQQHGGVSGYPEEYEK